MRSRACMTMTVAALASPLATAQLKPVDARDFGAGTIVETFEGELGTTIPPAPIGSGFIVPWGVIPTNHTFPSGVQMTAQSPQPDEMLLFDFFVAAGVLGFYNLGNGAGILSQYTKLPSGTACIAQSNAANGGVVEFTLPGEFIRVGAFVEGGAACGGRVTIEVFDANGASLGSHKVQTDGVGGDVSLDGFIGVESAVPIARVRVQTCGGILDDLMFDGANVPIEYGQGCPTGGGFPITPKLQVFGTTKVGQSLTAQISLGLGGSSAILVLGTGQGSIPLGGGCSLLVAPISRSFHASRSPVCCRARGPRRFRRP